MLAEGISEYHLKITAVEAKFLLFLYEEMKVFFPEYKVWKVVIKSSPSIAPPTRKLKYWVFSLFNMLVFVRQQYIAKINF